MKYPRYPKYKHSGIEWIGEIPENWNVRRLKYVIENFVGGGTPSTSISEYWDSENGFPWVSISDITNSDGIKDTERKITTAGMNSKKLMLLPSGTIIYSMYASVGKVSKLLTNATTNQAILGLLNNEHQVLNDYLRFSLEAFEPFVGFLFSSNTQNNINEEKVKNIVIPITDLGKQREIIRFLFNRNALVDNLLLKTKKMIDLLKEKRQAIITHSVTKGLDPNVPMKDSGIEWIGEIPENWQLKRLKYVVKFVTEKSERNTTQVALENIESWTGKYLPTDSEFKGDGIRFQSGDVLFGKLRPYLAKVYLAEFSGAAVGDFFVLRPFSDVDPNFLVNLLVNRELINKIDSSTYGAKMPRVDWRFMGELLVPIPPKAEQIKICNYIKVKESKIDSLMSKQQKMIDFLNEYKTSLITQAVTGKIDIRDYAILTTSNSIET